MVGSVRSSASRHIWSVSRITVSTRSPARYVFMMCFSCSHYEMRRDVVPTHIYHPYDHNSYPFPLMPYTSFVDHPHSFLTLHTRHCTNHTTHAHPTFYLLFQILRHTLTFSHRSRASTHLTLEQKMYGLWHFRNVNSVIQGARCEMSEAVWSTARKVLKHMLSKV